MIGKKITEARKKINISQAGLAERLFISSQAVGKWERGESMPDIITLNRLAEILGVDLNYFSGAEQTPAEATSAGPSNEQPVLASSDAEQLSPGQKEKPRWDMSRGNWVGADFSGLKNLHEKFSSSNMQGCRFVGSDLSGLLLAGNNVTGCDFSGSAIGSSQIRNSHLLDNRFNACSLKEAGFSGSHVSGCDFSGADFSGADFSGSHLSKCNLTNANFTGTKLKSGGFENNDVAGAVWNRTSFTAMYIADTVFEGTVEDCSFDNCAFKRVTFQQATLINTFFKNRSLKKIRFVDCRADRMTYEFLKNGKADLTGITLLTSNEEQYVTE
jgi:uncharacterized protein YjbI with pentapeptide repeats